MYMEDSTDERTDKGLAWETGVCGLGVGMISGVLRFLLFLLFGFCYQLYFPIICFIFSVFFFFFPPSSSQHSTFIIQS